MRRIAAALVTGLLSASAAAGAQGDADALAIRGLLQQVEQAALRADPEAYLRLLAGSANRGSAADFVEFEFRPGADRVVIQERDRRRLATGTAADQYRLTLDAFMEYGDRGRISTWQIDLTRVEDGWRIADQERLSSVDNLYRLSLTTGKQFDAQNFTIAAEDLELTLVDGSVFYVETDQGVTGLVLLGRGEMRFRPMPETEKGQVRIFTDGNDAIETRFETAFVRTGTFAAHADQTALTPRAVDPRDLRRAEDVFREESVKSFMVDLGDLSSDRWSLPPGPDDFLAEIRTRRFGTLTYSRAASEQEDVSLFQRRHQRNIAVYPSRDKLASRGRFYSEDERAPFDVLDYDIDVTAIPERSWIEGRSSMRLRVRQPALRQLTIRLADSLVVRSVSTPRFGRLFNLRVTNQDTILVNLPVALMANTELPVTIEYGGRLEPQAPDRETLGAFQASERDMADASGFLERPEARYLYSNRSYWYPQAMVSDYATATIQIAVPQGFGCVASGIQSSDSPRVIPGREPSQTRNVYLFSAERPLRYLAFVVSRFVRADRWNVVFNHAAAATPGGEAGEDAGFSPKPYDKLDIIVDANPRQAGRGRSVAERAVDIVQFYESLMQDAPYSALTVALTESRMPGGHSPGYFAVMSQPLASAPITWRNDPAAFSSFPEFFLAHEIAHQWWGQAVGWRNYHEQWLSEGFAQYFAALYAQKQRGDDVFESVLRQIRKWALDESHQGPVYLGYRIGHIKNDGRVFRAIVYNKGAAVLHMLRRFVGDAAFFEGLRRFYATSRFSKAGTEDLRLVMEQASGRSLERFFERWIYGATLPNIAFSYRVDGAAVLVKFEQTGELFDLPITLRLQYADRRSVNVVVPVTDRSVETRIPLAGVLRTIDVSRDDGTLAEITRSEHLRK